MSFWKTPEKRTAAKDHRCAHCVRRIDKGETYYACGGIEDDEKWLSWKSCQHCQAAIRLYTDKICWDEYVDFDAWEDPDDLAEARALVGYRMKWRHRYSHQLLPIPS